MRKDPTDWRNGFRIWKETGESPWEAGRRKELPEFADGKEKINYKRWDNAELTSYSVPFIKDKRVTLTNAGRATGAVLSTNLLDSLADNAVRGGLDPKTMIGISTKETTLGNPTDTKSAFNLSSGIRRLFNGKYPGTEQHINYWGDALNEREDVINYHKGHQTDDPKSGGKSVLQEAAEFFSKHPDSYNPRQPGYAKLVKKISDEVWLSPEIKRWYNAWTTKNKLKNSRWNRVNPLLKESKFNLPKYYLGTEGELNMGQKQSIPDLELVRKNTPHEQPVSNVDPIGEFVVKSVGATKGARIIGDILTKVRLGRMADTYRLIRKFDHDKQQYTGKSLRKENIRFADKMARESFTLSRPKNPLYWIMDPIAAGYSKLLSHPIIGPLIPF